MAAVPPLVPSDLNTSVIQTVYIKAQTIGAQSIETQTITFPGDVSISSDPNSESYNLTLPAIKGNQGDILKTSASGEMYWNIYTIKHVSTNQYTVLNTDDYIFVDYNNINRENVIINLPEITTNKIYNIYGSICSLNNISIIPYTGNFIQYTTEVLLTIDGSSITIINDGINNWFIN